ncbi:MAG: creatininase family protein [Acidobacteria bacterium]|nr:creatininase family protein [Acidobacteriota bacterium]
MDSHAPYRFEKLTWPEVNDAAVSGKLVVIPVATHEDHGPHLPIDADVVIASAVCRRTAELVSDEVVLFPCVEHGYSPHHLDFPGTVTIGWQTFVHYLRDITGSLVHHGFRKLLLVNGHGSNAPIVDLAARLTIVDHPHVHCGAVSWWELTRVREVFNAVRETPVISHACEAETSMYLAVAGEFVDMARAEPDRKASVSPHFWRDMLGRPPQPNFRNAVHMTEYWSTVTDNGVRGDPTRATARKGELILQAAAEELAAIITEMKARPVGVRVPHQALLPHTPGV